MTCLLKSKPCVDKNESAPGSTMYGSVHIMATSNVCVCRAADPGVWVKNEMLNA